MKHWKYEFSVPEAKRIRMIVSTDCKNEADDQFALAHHLMTPKFIVRGIVGAHFYKNPQAYQAEHTVDASVEEVNKVLKFMDLEGICPVYRGAECPLPDQATPVKSEGASFIIEEAMREDPHPLFIACQGCATDIASAILLKPEICDKLTVIWIGGGSYPEGEPEFNLEQDVNAANVLFSSKAALWQVPMNVYKQVSVSLAELQLKVRPCGEIGKYLFTQLVEYNNAKGEQMHWPHGEIWGLGDSPTIGLLLAEAEKKDMYEMVPAPNVDPETLRYLYDRENRKIRVYKDANARLTLEDFFAKLQINYGN